MTLSNILLKSTNYVSLEDNRRKESSTKKPHQKPTSSSSRSTSHKLSDLTTGAGGRGGGVRVVDLLSVVDTSGKNLALSSALMVALKQCFQLGLLLNTCRIIRNIILIKFSKRNAEKSKHPGSLEMESHLKWFFCMALSWCNSASSKFTLAYLGVTRDTNWEKRSDIVTVGSQIILMISNIIRRLHKNIIK